MVEAADLGRHRTIDLSTIGRRSGKWRRVEIWWFLFEDRLIITGTPGPRDWLANLRTDPKLSIHTPDGNFPGLAIVIDDLDYRRRFFAGRETRWYVDQAGLENLVAHAPMVEVSLA